MNDQIMVLISVAGLLFLLGCVTIRAFILNHRAGKLQKERARQLAERRKKEEEVLRKVKAIRERDDVGNAEAAVKRDPERAAKVVKTIMRKK